MKHTLATTPLDQVHAPHVILEAVARRMSVLYLSQRPEGSKWRVEASFKVEAYDGATVILIETLLPDPEGAKEIEGTHVILGIDENEDLVFLHYTKDGPEIISEPDYYARIARHCQMPFGLQMAVQNKIEELNGQRDLAVGFNQEDLSSLVALVS